MIHSHFPAVTYCQYISGEAKNGVSIFRLTYIQCYTQQYSSLYFVLDYRIEIQALVKNANATFEEGLALLKTFNDRLKRK